MRIYQMKRHFKGFAKLVIYHSCRLHSTNLGNDSARGFSDAVVGDSFAIERTI